jgi:hypothetical protein
MNRSGGHARQRVPTVDEGPAWILCDTGAGPLRRRVIESLFTLGAGGVATRGSVEEAAPGAQPMVLAIGVHDRTGPGQHLLPGPAWTGLAVEPVPVRDRQVLDLRTDALERTELAVEYPLGTVRLASITVPEVVAMRAEASSGRLPRPGRPLWRPPGTKMAAGREDGMHWARIDARAGRASPPWLSSTPAAMARCAPCSGWLPTLATGGTGPKFWDQHAHAGQAWGQEFLAHYRALPGARLELRSGAAAEHVVKVAGAE